MSDSPFSLIAGHVALDFCNTVDWRLDPASRFERITAYDDLLAWSAAAGVLDPPEVALLTTPTLAAGCSVTCTSRWKTKPTTSSTGTTMQVVTASPS